MLVNYQEVFLAGDGQDGNGLQIKKVGSLFKFSIIVS